MNERQQFLGVDYLLSIFWVSFSENYQLFGLTTLYIIEKGFQFNFDHYLSILILSGHYINIVLCILVESFEFNFDCYLSIFSFIGPDPISTYYYILKVFNST